MRPALITLLLVLAGAAPAYAADGEKTPLRLDAGSPAPGTAGSYPLTITASNPTGSTRQAFTLTVDPGHPPTRRSLQAR